MHLSRSRLATFVVVVAATLAVTSLFVAARGGAEASTGPAGTGPASAGEPAFPRPGGGPQAISGLTSLLEYSEPVSYLLDVGTGSYRSVPYELAILSPDRRLVAVAAIDGRIGVASRRALPRVGEPAVRWTGLPAGVPQWSPDGSALLVNTIDKGDAPPGEFAAHRYDLDTGRIRTTPIDGLACDNCFAGWAADSIRYVVMLRGSDPERPEGPAQYVNPDGSPGPLVGIAGHIWDADAYSPTRRYVIVEPVRPTELALPPVIFDLRTGSVVATIETFRPLVGWYDERRVVRISPDYPHTVLEVVDIHTGEVVKQVRAPRLPDYRIQVGSSRGLDGQAAELGF